MRLELRQLSCGYKKEEPVLQNVTMDLSDGDICCILGPNGVGKTTLFKTILGILPLLGGAMVMDGTDLASWPQRRRAKSIAYVAQSHEPGFPYLTEEIVMMGRLGLVGRFSQPSRRDHEIVERILCDMGLDYLKGRPYTDISGGERQLLMIARALAQEPDLLILDEPTANLDFGNMARVLARMKALAEEGLCILFTSHQPDQAFLCRAKTALIMRGEPLIFGRCEHVVTPQNLMKAYHAPVQMADVLTAQGSPIRMCAPVLEEM